MGSVNLFAISFPGWLGRNSFLVIKNKLPVPIAFPIAFLKRFSKDEVITIEKKFAEVKKLENIERVQGFIFSRSGFTKDAEDYCREKGIACSEDEKWLESGKLTQPLV